MSKILYTTAVVIALAFAAVGAASAKVHPFHAQPGYATPVPSWASRPARTGESDVRFVPGRGIVGESCDLPTSACPNDDRIND
jgi:hypothetical protein